MKKLLILAALVAVAALMLAPTSGIAKGKQLQKIDLGKMTCEEFLQEAGQDPSGETAGYMLMWLDGYLSGVTGDTVLDGKQFEAFATELSNLCAKKPKTNLLEAAQSVGVAK